MEASPGSDAEAIAHHWLGAGEATRAAGFAEEAAARSAAKLAFDHAARLIRIAIDSTPASSERAHVLRVRLAEVLQHGGRYVESARAYIEAAEASPPGQRLAFRGAAAHQLLTAGRLDEGEELLHEVLAEVGVKAPRSQLLAVVWLLLYRLWSATLGLRPRERDPSQVAEKDRTRLDALQTGAMGFALVNFILGACMSAWHLALALRRGDRRRVSQAAALEAINIAAAGGRESERERALVALSRTLAKDDPDPAARVMPDGLRGIGLFQRGRWAEADRCFERGLSFLHYGNPGVSNVLLFDAYTKAVLGDLNESRRRMTKLLREARERGDKYTLVNLNTSLAPSLALAAGDPERARRILREALADWPARGFFVQHWNAAVYGTEADIYTGDARAGYERFTATLPRIKSSILLQSSYLRIATWGIIARAALASIPSWPEARPALLAEARQMARRLEREQGAWPGSQATIIRACIANAEGDRSSAIASLREALSRMESPDQMLGLAASHRLGLLLGGEEGRAVLRKALEKMRAQGVREPERWAGVYVPGTWVASEIPH
jgi:tetratricopeptide (TPR) repeat protein